MSRVSPNTGFFKPKNPSKYVGDPTNIIYRSFFEFKLMMYLDHNKDVLFWNSEEIAIPYLSPIDQRVHRYFPDFLVKIKDKEGKEKIYMIEVKPAKQTQPPRRPKKMTKSFLAETEIFEINKAKWAAAKQYCLNKGWEFKIFTEKELGIK